MFISVIVPVYNVEKYLNKCMTSLLNQHYTDMEIIIVDDKSTDSSLSIAKGYKKYKNIKVISKEKNSGLSDSRNIGIREASGKYIMFLDSDDYVEDDCFFKIQEIVKEEHEPDIVYFGYYEEYEDTNIKNVKYGYVTSRNHAYTGEEFAFAELRKRNLPVVHVKRKLEVKAANEMTADLLDIKEQDPVFYFHTYGYTKNEVPIEYSIATYRGDENYFLIDLKNKGG